MTPKLVPIKTAEGQQELAHRVRRLSQRHRTVLLLVDGRRDTAQVLQMAAAAGVPADCFEELRALGLVTLAAPGGAGPIDLELPLPGEDSVLPAARSLLPESEHGALGEPVFADAPAEPAPADAALEEAREMLVRAVRNEAPVTGSLTLMKLRRAASREELQALLDEVEQRIRKPRKQIIAAQLMRQVRHLLSLPVAAP